MPGTVLSTLQAFSHVAYSSPSAVGRQNYPTITDEETKVLRLHFLPQITQLVRGRSELDPNLCPKSLCSPSHSAASLPPTVQGSHSGHSTNTGHCQHQHCQHYLEPRPRPSSHTQLGGATTLQGTQPMTDTSLPALIPLDNSTALGFFL